MAVHLRALLILMVLTGHGILSLTTVSKVSVPAGGSVSIPCLYGSHYINHVKYLCQGYYYSSCSYAITTNQKNSRKFSISDCKSQRIFTVSVHELRDADTGYFWCVVEINGGKDAHEYFHLSVTSGTPSLYVDHQEVTGYEGDDITINCYYRTSGEMKWCKLGSSCVQKPSGSIDGTNVTINASVPDVFPVTMSGLRTESSGWYYCVKGDLQMPVHVTVTQRPSTTTTDRDTTAVQDAAQQSGSVDLKSFIIPLSLLIIIVLVALFIWLKLRRNKQKKAESAAMAAAEGEITYSHVKHKRKPPNQIQSSHVENEVDVTYSSVVTTRRPHELRDEENNDNVIYSTPA